MRWDEIEMVTLVVPGAGRPWVSGLAAWRLAETLGIDVPLGIQLDPPELVKLARLSGYELFPLVTHAELERFWARCVEHQLEEQAEALLDRLRLHVPGIWRSDELSRQVRPFLASLYGRTGLPVVHVQQAGARADVAVGPWRSIAQDLVRLPLHVVRRAEVARALRLVMDPPAWLADWGVLTDQWFALVGEGRTIYVPAHEPVEIDPLGVLSVPVPPRYIVACSVGEQRVAMLGPYATDAEAVAHIERATQCARTVGWQGSVEVIPAILPERLTVCAQLAPRCAAAAEPSSPLTMETPQ